MPIVAHGLGLGRIEQAKRVGKNSGLERIEARLDVNLILRFRGAIAMGSAKGSPVRPSSGVLLASDGSFSALLGLPSDQAVNLLHRLPDPNAVASSGEMRRLCLPPRPKAELLDSAGLRLIAQRSAKRKEGENSRGESPAKKSKRRSEEGTACGKKLPCVHVRARRGQATDSHSLAERVYKHLLFTH